MVNSYNEFGFKMEEILSELLRDASASKLKALQDACTSANGNSQMLLHVLIGC